MQLTDAVGHRALAYVAAVSRHGYALTVEEFNAYVSLPILRRESKFQELARALAASPALASTPKESILQWLGRLGWLREEGGHVFITRLGRAVLAGVEESGREEELPAELVLDPADALSYAKLIGTIAEAGECALVEGYFSIDSFLDIVQRTHVTRILVRPDAQKTGRLEALQQAVQDHRFDRPLEIRSGDDFHDRFVIPPDGPVRFIGTSLGGVGRRLAATGKIGEPAASGIRAAFEEAWKLATVVACGVPEEKDQPAELTPEAAAAVARAAEAAVDGRAEESGHEPT